MLPQYHEQVRRMLELHGGDYIPEDVSKAVERAERYMAVTQGGEIRQDALAAIVGAAVGSNSLAGLGRPKQISIETAEDKKPMAQKAGAGIG